MLTIMTYKNATSVWSCHAKMSGRPAPYQHCATKGKNGTCHRMTWVDQWASEVEGSASLDFLVLHEVWSDHLLENNFSHIHKLSFYHSIRWPLIFFWYYASKTDALSSIAPSVSLFMHPSIPSWHFYTHPRHDHIPSHDLLHGSSIFLDKYSTLTYYS